MFSFFPKSCHLTEQRAKLAYLPCCTQIITHLAQETGHAPCDAVAQFTAAYATFGQNTQVPFEFVLSYKKKVTRYGFLTQGAARKNLAASIAHLLRSTRSFYIESGGNQTDIALLDDATHIAFPKPQALNRFQASSQALLMGIGPRSNDSQVDFKIYLNTRMGPSGDHTQRVHALFNRTGCSGDFHNALVALYNDALQCQFVGVGIDAVADDPLGRCKLYVRTPTQHAQRHLCQLASVLQIELNSELLLWFAPSDVADAVEIAVAFYGNKPSLKLTFFFAESQDQTTVLKHVTRLLHAYHYSSACLMELTSYPLARIHAVGFEFPVHPMPKINIYLKPLQSPNGDY